MRKRANKRVWYIHHAESEALYKTYDYHWVRKAEIEQADIINNECYLNWKKKYGQKQEYIYEQSSRSWDDDIPF